MLCTGGAAPGLTLYSIQSTGYRVLLAVQSRRAERALSLRVGKGVQDMDDILICIATNSSELCSHVENPLRLYFPVLSFFVVSRQLLTSTLIYSVCWELLVTYRVQSICTKRRRVKINQALRICHSHHKDHAKHRWLSSASTDHQVAVANQPSVDERKM